MHVIAPSRDANNSRSCSQDQYSALNPHRSIASTSRCCLGSQSPTENAPSSLSTKFNPYRAYKTATSSPIELMLLPFALWFSASRTLELQKSASTATNNPCPAPSRSEERR